MFMFLLLVTLASAVLAVAFHNTMQTKKTLAKTTVKVHIPTAITMFIVVAHLTELTHAIENVSVMEAIVSLALFTLWTASKSGTETEL